MKKIIVLVFVLGLFTQCNNKNIEIVKQTKDSTNAWRSSAPKAAAARKIQIADYTDFTLDNGLQVIVVENHKLPRISFQLSLKNDPILEKDQVGYVSFAQTLMKTGTTKRQKAEIDESIDYIGASLSTNNGIFGSSLTKHSEKLLDVFTDVLYNPTFPKSEFDKLKKQKLSSLSTAKTDPSTIAGNVAAKLLYGSNHPYGEVETEETVNNISLEKCKEYYKTFYKPNNAFLVIVGDIEPAKAKVLAIEYFGEWSKGNIPKMEYANLEAPSGNQVSFANKDGAVQSLIRITYPIILKPGAPDILASSIANSILGGGIFLGRLMQNLREDKAYTYGARSALRSNKLVGNFNASASVRNEVTDSSIHEFIYEMQKMATEPISLEDLKLAKSSMAGSFARSLESPETIAKFALNTFRYNLPKDYYSSYLERLEKVTIEDVSNAASKYIKPNNAHILVVGSKEDVAKKLLQYDSENNIDYYDAFGNAIEYDNSQLHESITPELIISDYINVIGGEHKLANINAIESIGKMDIMGQAADVSLVQKDGNKMSMKITLGDMVVMEQLLDGKKLKISQMGQSQIMESGPEVDQALASAKVFKEREYLQETYELELQGVDNIESKKVYKIKITPPQGEIVTQYYEISTNLLIREVTKAEQMGQEMTVTIDFSDYRDVEGIMIPHQLTTTGAGPVPFTIKASEVKLNSIKNDDLFMLD